MKTLFLLLLTVLFLSCTNDKAIDVDSSQINSEYTRGTTAYQIVEMQESDDEDIINGIKNTLMSAEKEKALLSLSFVASDEPVDNGLFVFNIKLVQEKSLNFKIYDEEGYELGHNDLNLTAGENYKALNVKSFEDGHYLLRLEDEAGAEYEHSFAIQKK